MHNLAVIFDKMLNICKHFGKEFTNEKGNLPLLWNYTQVFRLRSNCFEFDGRNPEY